VVSALELKHDPQMVRSSGRSMPRHLAAERERSQILGTSNSPTP
jgi:hypothetical protein